MSKIVYFNINYCCNSNCTFCFSNSTGKEKSELSIEEIIDRLKTLQLEETDLIVLNGGEPTLHSKFYIILETLLKNVPCHIKVYTNGTLINPMRLVNTNRISFVIPVHGYQDTHNEITRVPGLYERTINTLTLLEKSHFDYSIKFIMNTQMIRSSFDIQNFISLYDFHPKEVIIARLNNTDKARRNMVEIPSSFEIKRYLNSQLINLDGRINVKLLDIPLCYLDYECEEPPHQIPTFIFNDYKNIMSVRQYYKEVLLGEQCKNCINFVKCRLLTRSYLTLFLNEYVLKFEVE